MNIYGEGWEEVGEEDFDAPEPPPRGTVAWRRVVLGICATDDYDTYHEALLPVWQWRGWQLGVDVMTELLIGISRSVPQGHELRDAFGRIQLHRAINMTREEDRLEHALELARLEQEEDADLPPHEALRRTVARGELFSQMVEEALSSWQEALYAMADHGHDPQVGAPFIIRYLNTTGERSARAASMALMLHGTLRRMALPPGKDWVDAWVRPDALGAAPASPAAHFGTRLNVADPLMDQLTKEWKATARQRPAARPRRKGKKGRQPCPGCGGYHP